MRTVTLQTRAAMRYDGHNGEVCYVLVQTSCYMHEAHPVSRVGHVRHLYVRGSGE